MPYNIFGEHIESQPPLKQRTLQAKVGLVRRGQSKLIVICGLEMAEDELKSFAAGLKRELGCGGTIKNGALEIQGDKQEAVASALIKRGIKVKQ